MARFSKPVIDFWQAPFVEGQVLYSDEIFTVVTNQDLPEDCQIMTLETTDNKLMVVLTPTIADRLALSQHYSLSAQIFLELLRQAGIVLYGADYVFYFSEDDKKKLLQENIDGNIRQLTKSDEGIFSAFQSSASAQDLDDAYVELDHWTVFGSFEKDRLVSAASMYPWEDTELADLGVLTLPPFRGKGYARKLVRSICKYAFAQGYEPQYRCQTDNSASVALAKAAGLTLFGKWNVIS